MLTAKLAAAAALTAALVLAPAHAAATDAPADAQHWRWPASPPGAIVAPFVAPPGPYDAGHRGVDLAASPGQGVLAPTTAVVQFSGVVVDRPVVTLRVDEHVLVSFEPVATELAVGTPVTVAEQFGAVGRGGHCDERCIHVGVRVDGEYVSPLAFFAGVPPAVLLPLE
jgi:hypothetical protein